MQGELESKINDRTAVVGIMGLGYVGLPLALSFAKEFKVIGFDVSKQTISVLLKGESHIGDIKDEQVTLTLNKSFFPTTDPKRLRECDAIIICVPTPLRPNKEPDLSYIRSAAETVKESLKQNMLVVLESTTYPGTTENVLQPILEKTGLRVGKDFFLAFSPERIDPGNKNFHVTDIPKIVGGIEPQSTLLASALYSSIIKKVCHVRNARTAEAVKMMENVFRNVNIALVNEMALIFERLDIDAWEVIDAAKTKPFGFMPFYPGPGIGGHCIPLDPLYMSYISKRSGYTPRFIEMASEINDFMKLHAVNLLERALVLNGISMADSTICVLGLAYKKDVGDARETPSTKIIEEILERGAGVKAYDPFVKSISTSTQTIHSEAHIEEAAKGCEAILILMNHEEFLKTDYLHLASLLKHPIIVDCKNVLKPMDGIFYFGLGKPNK